MELYAVFPGQTVEYAEAYVVSGVGVFRAYVAKSGDEVFVHSYVGCCRITWQS